MLTVKDLCAFVALVLFGAGLALSARAMSAMPPDLNSLSVTAADREKSRVHECAHVGYWPGNHPRGSWATLSNGYSICSGHAKRPGSCSAAPAGTTS